MKTTIDAMKKAVFASKNFMRVMEGEGGTAPNAHNLMFEAISGLDSAIAHEEAQTVEPLAWISPAMVEVLLTHPSGHTVLCGRRTSPGRTIPLFTHPAQSTKPSGDREPVRRDRRAALEAGLRTMAGSTSDLLAHERAWLIDDLKSVGESSGYIIMGQAADMLAADELLEAKAWHRGRDAGIAEVARVNAHQVAVPDQFVSPGHARGYSTQPPQQVAVPQDEELCHCDKNNLGDPGVSCGDCPTRDYKPPQELS